MDALAADRLRKDTTDKLSGKFESELKRQKAEVVFWYDGELKSKTAEINKLQVGQFSQVSLRVCALVSCLLLLSEAVHRFLCVCVSVWLSVS